MKAILLQKKLAELIDKYGDRDIYIIPDTSHKPRNEFSVFPSEDYAQNEDGTMVYISGNHLEDIKNCFFIDEE